MISGGRLRWNAMLLKAATTVDSLGRRTNTFTDSGRFRCDIRESSPVEQNYADGVAVTASYEVRVRWPNVARLEITELDRIYVREKTLRINGIQNLDERDRLAVIDCTEVA